MNLPMLSAAAAALVLAACAPVRHTVAAADGSPVAVIEASHGSTFDAEGTTHLTVGDRLTVRIEGNPTTGYVWADDYPGTNILRQTGVAAYQASTAPGIVGAGGVYLFSFKAVAPGTVPVKLIYYRPWERNTPPVNTFTFTAVVAP